MKEHRTSSIPEAESSSTHCMPSLVTPSGAEPNHPLTSNSPSRSNRLLEGCREPSRAELRAIEHDSELLGAELALVDAECAWYANPNPETAADLFGALIRLVDIYDLMVHQSERAVA